MDCDLHVFYHYLGLLYPKYYFFRKYLMTLGGFIGCYTNEMGYS